jgi:hypothetical protein
MAIPMDRGTTHLAKQKEAPLHASNEYETLHQSKFDSERRSPWSEKMGKDDLSYFFDTHQFDQSFDQVQRQPVQCPSEWEEQGGRSPPSTPL